MLLQGFHLPAEVVHLISTGSTENWKLELFVSVGVNLSQALHHIKREAEGNFCFLCLLKTRHTRGLRSPSWRLWARTTWSWSRISSRSSARSHRETRWQRSWFASWRSLTSRCEDHRLFLAKPVFSLYYRTFNIVESFFSSDSLSWRPTILWHQKTTRLLLPAPAPSWIQLWTTSPFLLMPSGWWGSVKCLASTWWVHHWNKPQSPPNSC